MIKGDKNTDYAELVTLILGLSNDTAPVELSFGFVDEKNHCRKGIVLKNAAPKILSELIKKGYSADVMHDGVHIYDYR